MASSTSDKKVQTHEALDEGFEDKSDDYNELDEKVDEELIDQTVVYLNDVDTAYHSEIASHTDNEFEDVVEVMEFLEENYGQIEEIRGSERPEQQEFDVSEFEKQDYSASERLNEAWKDLIEKSIEFQMSYLKAFTY